MSASASSAVLVLENGRVFRGESFGHKETTFAEIVFNTSLSGYQEILSDPSYAGQAVVMTAPQIGNTGICAEDMESLRPHCSGLIVREQSPVASNWRSEGTLNSFLQEHKIVGIEGVDTRALTRCLRTDGAMRGVIALGDSSEKLVAEVLASPSMEGLDLAKTVSCKEPYKWSEGAWIPPEYRAESTLAAIKFKVVAYDFGIKHNILRDLRSLGCDVEVVPAGTSAADVIARKPDGVFLSNGPGDPASVTYAVEAIRELLETKLPIFGICLGHQLLSLALGAKSFKLPFGHHGGNHPVMDLETRKVDITSQNHGFAIDEKTLPDSVRMTHVNLYDGTVEGIELVERPVFGVQYHPESSPGPRDASHLFRRFVKSMAEQK